MSERGFIISGGGLPDVFMPESEFHRLQKIFGGKSYGRLDAFCWLAIYAPVKADYKAFATAWNWSRAKVRRYIHQLVGAGLVTFDGLTIIPIGDPNQAIPTSDGSWISLREAVFARDGYRCTYCGSQENLQCDHVHPRAKGGSDALDNLTTACQQCNASKRDRLISEWRQ
jgi:HNH endonuclease